MLWVIVAILTVITARYVLAPMMHESAATKETSDVDVYKSQLEEIDRDIARGVLAPTEAERTKVEISRRLLAAARKTDIPGTKSKKLSTLQAGAFVMLITAAAVVTYWMLGAPNEPDQPLGQRLVNAELLRDARPSQENMVAAAPPRPAVEAPEEYLAQVAQLRVLVPQRPNDLRGWVLLAKHEAELLEFDAAAKAQAQIVALREPVELADLQRLLDLMVFAANGLVSKESERVAIQMLEIDQENIAARYYLGALDDQTGRPDIAFRRWRPMVESGVDTFHIALARNQIANTAIRAGIDYEPPAMLGPDLETIAAANGLSQTDRAEMVQGMVAQLSDRLATQGGSPTEWARLIRAHGVLGELTTAREVFTEGMNVFGSDPNAVAVLQAAAESAGISE